ncbi:Nitrate reductase molybdenum cofactor assembly chaperone [Candidatus Hydrogenisulfobacillus filiaventi]|uniref:Nitrate reductase molybdenum cofactor assembly chaperone n=1 Tax=Candidatus Hydrogenisulfobacillus filiaventi TaxID=2707344 RepID=A0A6F8ZG86_9FIRM|nr:nitrate reductase molybdenum cofactor assembly chaperone [Bacillota bacterium]CAB1129005.1 Nitrate reductase molybdenum cofactor assembly chaperone [Candidatus Hydrogenisulfobacillus filiaventi]
MTVPDGERMALKLAAFLAGYPDRAFWRVWRQVPAVLAQVDPALRPRLAEAVAALEGRDPLDLEAHYVEVFDFAEDTGLALTFHEHGDSRARGQALLALQDLLRQEGFRPQPGVLPDHLPLLLEFLAVAPESPARAAVARRVAPVAARLAERLQARGSPYAAVWQAISSLLPAGTDALPAGPARQDARELFDLPYPLAPGPAAPGFPV